jgi:cell wall-associated NlpC family hydrolase
MRPGAATAEQLRHVVKIALAEVGTKEVRPNRGPILKYGGRPGQPWCGFFVRWCFAQAGVVLPGKFEYQGWVQHVVDSCKLAGIWHDVDGFVPALGDIIFFATRVKSDPFTSSQQLHVGIVAGATDYTVHTVEGNSSDAVDQRSYKTTNKVISGYARLRVASGS